MACDQGFQIVNVDELIESVKEESVKEENTFMWKLKHTWDHQLVKYLTVLKLF